MRPDWDEFWLGIAEAASARAECRRRKVGAVIVRDNKVVGLGYNGALPGAPSCLDGACPRGLMTYDEVAANSDYANCIATHGEANALRNTSPERRAGSTCYVNHEPCPACRTLLQSTKIARAVWPGGEHTFEGNQ